MNQFDKSEGFEFDIESMQVGKMEIGDKSAKCYMTLQFTSIKGSLYEDNRSSLFYGAESWPRKKNNSKEMLRFTC